MAFPPLFFEKIKRKNQKNDLGLVWFKKNVYNMGVYNIKTLLRKRIG